MENAPIEERPEIATRSRRMKIFYRWGFVASLVAVVGGSFCAYTGRLPTALPGFEGADKIAHFFAIGIVAFFLDGAIERRALVKRPVEIPLASAAVLFAAGVDEYLQRYSPRRDSSFGDFAADIAGVAVLTLASRWLARRVLGESATATLAS